MEKLKKNETEDECIEYQSLRTELNQSDNTCLLMTGFIVTAVGALFSIEKPENVLWTISLLCLIGLFYYTEKRFIIKNISFYIKDILSTEETGFKWEKYAELLRNGGTLRPFKLFKPYYFEVSICILGSLSPLLYSSFMESNITKSGIAWMLITLIIITLSIINIIKYSKLKSPMTRAEFLKKINYKSEVPSA